MEKKQINDRCFSALEEAQRGITIKVTDFAFSAPDRLTLRDVVERNLTKILLQLETQKLDIYQDSFWEFRVPKKIGEADPKPKGKIKLRRVLEY